MAGMGYSFVMTTLILWIMHFIPYLSLRIPEEAEIVGIDDYEMGEYAYDYVGLEQDLGVKDIEGGLEHERMNATSGGREPRHAAHADHSSSASDIEKRDPVAA